MLPADAAGWGGFMIDLPSRLGRVQEALRSRGIGTLLVYDAGRLDVREPNELFALTDYRTLGPALLLVPARGAPVLVLSPAWDLPRARTIPGLAVVHAVGGAEVATRAAAAARDLPQPVAFSGRAVVPNAVWKQLVTALAAEPADGEGLVVPARAIRTAEELERIEHAAAIADIGFNALRQLAKPGMREYELSAEVVSAMHTAGADDTANRIASGPRVEALRPACDRRLAKGDVIVSEMVPGYRGYFAQLGRTFVLGEPGGTQEAAFVQLVAAEETRLRDEAARLEPSMTLTVDVGRVAADTGYFACADTFAIGADGPRRLTQTARELFGRVD